MYVGLARVACERNDLEAAAAHLVRAGELPEAGLPQNPYRWRVTLADVRAAHGDLDGALALLDEAGEVFVGDFSPDVRPVASSRARVLAARGDLAAAWAWVRERGLSTSDPASYAREHEHLTLVRVVLAQHRIDRPGTGVDDAARLLDRILEAAGAGGRTGTVIEALALAALVRGDAAPLERALALAEPEGYARAFLAEGEPMAALLRRVGTAYARQLLRPTSAPPAPAPAQQLVDPLSERELDVLRLLASDLSGPDIARELVVSLNTVRTHTRHIYAKLGVDNRRAAVSRARQLGLFQDHHATHHMM
jgi:LuxR family maltose regulon positive regulatory protein